jgi:transposase InsO family protein
MQKHNLLVKAETRIKADRRLVISKTQPDQPNQSWVIDMTEVIVYRFGGMYITLVLDWYAKKIIGYYTGMQCCGKHWLEALKEVANLHFPNGIQEHGLCAISDNGNQPASLGIVKACQEFGIQRVFTNYNNPKEKADTERVFRNMKEHLFWLRQWINVFLMIEALKTWISYRNSSYLHVTFRV